VDDNEIWDIVGKAKNQRCSVGLRWMVEPEEEATERNRFKSEKDVTVVGGGVGTEVGVFR
jgi:hypothetical protein